MKRLKRAIGGTLVVALVGGVIVANADDPPRRQTPREAQTYESPILSLLLLPVNILVKMASALGPAEKDASRSDRGRSPQRPAR